MTNRVMMTISLTPETKERLNAFAKQTHRSASQAITDWIWQQPVEMPKLDNKKAGETNE